MVELEVNVSNIPVHPFIIGFIRKIKDLVHWRDFKPPSDKSVVLPQFPPCG